MISRVRIKETVETLRQFLRSRAFPDGKVQSSRLETLGLRGHAAPVFRASVRRFHTFPCPVGRCFFSCPLPHPPTGAQRPVPNRAPWVNLPYEEIFFPGC